METITKQEKEMIQKCVRLLDEKNKLQSSLEQEFGTLSDESVFNKQVEKLCYEISRLSLKFNKKVGCCILYVYKGECIHACDLCCASIKL